MLRLLGEAIEALRIAAAAIRANATRGILTALGIVIGIVGVVSTMTAANGLSQSFRSSIEVLGSDVLYVSRMPWVMQGRFFDFRNRPRLNLKHVDQLEQRLAGAVAVNPNISTQRTLQFESDSIRNTEIIGTTDKLVLMSSAVPELGRFITGFDVRSSKRVCVIGASVRQGLFEGRDPINQKLRIGRHNFRVIGVMEKMGNASFFDGPDFDSRVFVPVTAFVKAFGSAHRDIDIAVKAPSTEAMADFEYSLIGAMRGIRGLRPTEQDDFAINTMDSLVQMFNRVMGVTLLVGIVITGIALFVGGIGVMNIMFVSVTERTREIGVRKALGATRRAILAQFLFESASICLVGGMVGLLAAWGVTRLVDALLLPASLSWTIVAVALVVAALVGIVSGLVPALRAARLDPVDALRYE